MFTVECLVMIKQILTWCVNGVLQSGFWVGILLGPNDNLASTITIGFDLEMERAGEYMWITSYRCKRHGCKPGCVTTLRLQINRKIVELHIRVMFMIEASQTHLSKTTFPFEPTAKSGRLSLLRSKDDWLIDMPKNIRSELTSEPAILYVDGNIWISW